QFEERQEPVTILGLGVYAFIEAAGAASGLTISTLSGPFEALFGTTDNGLPFVSNSPFSMIVQGTESCYAEPKVWKLHYQSNHACWGMIPISACNKLIERGSIVYRGIALAIPPGPRAGN